MLCAIIAFAAELASMVLSSQAAEPFSHQDWQTVLEEFVDDRGLVDYHSLSRNRDVFDRYILALGQSSPEANPELFPTLDHALAYYINAYNAFAFRGVLALGPDTPSVWGRSGLGVGFFVRQKHRMGGRRISLKKLEDDVIRKGFQDPRIHAALNCASLDCPRLLRTAFSGDSLDSQLESAMREWITGEAAVRIEPERQTVVLSKIFDWFRKDFLQFEARAGSDSPSLVGYLNRYRDAGERIPESFEEEIRKYDKRLNGQP